VFCLENCSRRLRINCRLVRVFLTRAERYGNFKCHFTSRAPLDGRNNNNNTSSSIIIIIWYCEWFFVTVRFTVVNSKYVAKSLLLYQCSYHLNGFESQEKITNQTAIVRSETVKRKISDKSSENYNNIITYSYIIYTLNRG